MIKEIINYLDHYIMGRRRCLFCNSILSMHDIKKSNIWCANIRISELGFSDFIMPLKCIKCNCVFRLFEKDNDDFEIEFSDNLIINKKYIITDTLGLHYLKHNIDISKYTAEQLYIKCKMMLIFK